MSCVQKYEVVMLQTRTGTPPDLGSVDNFYVAILLNPALPFYACHLMSSGGGRWGTCYALSLSPFTTAMSPHRIIQPPGNHLFLYQHT